MEEPLVRPGSLRSPASRVREAPGPRDLLAWLVEGDPLGLRDLARAELDRRWLLWDADALALRAMALVAHRAGIEGRRRYTAPFLGACMQAAVDELARPEGAGGARDLEHVGALLGFTGPAVARACRRHNRRPTEERRAFRRLVVDGAELDAVAHELERDAASVARAARRVLDELLAVLLSPSGGATVLDLKEDMPRGADLT